MLFWLIALSAGIGFLLVSTNALVSSSQLLAVKWRVSPLIVGTLVVALVTSLPELTVSVVAALKHDTQLAMGNIIGSNIINILIVFPAGILAGKLRIGTTKSQKNALFLFAAVIIYCVLSLLGLPHRILSLILLALIGTFILLEFSWASAGRKHEDAKAINKYSHLRVKLGVFRFLIISSGILAGGLMVVSSVEYISSATGLSTGFLGLSLAAMATSLPELLTSVFSQEHHQAKEMLGDVLGSNIYNLLLIGGLVYLISDPAPSGLIELIWLLASSGLFMVILRYYQGKVVPKKIALILLVLSLLYFSTIYLL